MKQIRILGKGAPKNAIKNQLPLAEVGGNL